MRQYRRYFLLGAPFVVAAILTASFGQRRATTMSESLPLDHWGIPKLAAYLNEAGVQVRMQSAQKDGIIRQSVYLTSTQKDWRELNCLVKDPSWIHMWQGIVFCTHETPNAAEELVRQWGDQGLLAGPFAFYGDAELLVRIKDALNHPAPVDAT